MLKRADGRWQDQIKLPGMSKPKYFYGKTQKEVKQKMAAWRQEQAQGKSFEAAADAWECYHDGQVSYNGSLAYRTALARAKEHFRGRQVQDIGPDEINAYLRYLADRGYSRRTVQLYLDMLNMIYDYAIINRWTVINPCGPVKVPTGLPQKKREIPTNEELEKVKAGICYEFGLFPYMLLYTGLRRGELLALKWEDIDRENRTIHITKSVYYESQTPKIKEPKTEAGRRTVVLLDALNDVLPAGGSGYIFGGERPMKRGEYNAKWMKWCKDAGLATSEKREVIDRRTNKKGKHTKWTASITAHQLRHAFATILFDAGIDVKDAQDILGHSSIQVTRDIYTHIRQERKEKTIAKINEYLRGDTKTDK